VDISIIVSTYNRGSGLRATLESLVVQEVPGVDYEVIVVDNNSTDDTGDVIRRVAATHPRVRHLFEPKQGVSFGRNAGLAVATSPIIAFTDDDVIVPPSWLAAIARAFDAHPEVDYVTGRILPIWVTPAPAWMATVNNGPCALFDAGDTPRVSEAGSFFPGWATANIAFRRSVFDRLGGFNGEFPRGQDLELILRVWRSGSRGCYAPDVAVHHTVHPDRMTRTFHREWQHRQGVLRARLGFWEIFDAGDRILQAPRRGARLGGVPAHLWRQLAQHSLRWVGATLTRDAMRAFKCECMVRQTLSYMRARSRAALTLAAAPPRVDADQPLTT
jgi:glycosyltransferase involved in cell wall biosynthesis